MAENDNTPAENFDALDAMELPGIPTADELRASILGGDARDGLAPHAPLAGVKISRPLAATTGERLTAAGLSAHTRRLAQIGELARGPADDANPYQRHLIVEASRERSHWDKVDRLTAEMNEATGQFDQNTGQPIYVIGENRRAGMAIEINNLLDEITRIDGPAGELVRQRKLEEAVVFEQRKAKLAYIEREAQKRAVQINIDRQINARAEMIATVAARRGE